MFLNEIRVVAQGRFDRSRDTVAAITVLSDPQRESIVAAIRAIPSPLFGREHASGAADGIRLFVSFTTDGRRGPDEIMLSNTWREGITPLVDAVSRCLSAEHRIHFHERISEYQSEDDVAWTWREVDAMRRGVCRETSDEKEGWYVACPFV